MIARGINWVRVVKYVWVMASLSVWLFGSGSCATEPSCFFAQTFVFPFVIFLSLPAGLLFFIFVGPFIDIHPSIDYPLLCLGAFAVGYFQWFHAIPKLFGKMDITRLCLNHPDQAGVGEQELSPKRARPAKSKPTRITPFDKAGRTPLDRAINRTAQPRLSNASGKTWQSSTRR